MMDGNEEGKAILDLSLDVARCCRLVRDSQSLPSSTSKKCGLAAGLHFVPAFTRLLGADSFGLYDPNLDRRLGLLTRQIEATS